jgi:hypothetical protein
MDQQWGANPFTFFLIFPRILSLSITTTLLYKPSVSDPDPKEPH